jgi:hypothetical protein
MTSRFQFISVLTELHPYNKSGIKELMHIFYFNTGKLPIFSGGIPVLSGWLPAGCF